MHTTHTVTPTHPHVHTHAHMHTHTHTHTHTLHLTAANRYDCILKTSQPRTQASKYSYQVKVFDSNSKRKFVIRQLHHFTDWFTSVDHVMDVVSSEIENLSDDYNIGYFEGRAHSKQWLVSNEDLRAMYEKFCEGGRWCENIESEKEQTPPSKRKKKKTRNRLEERTKKKS